MRPEAARNALLATHGGLSLELCATICHISPMALYYLICALGRHSLVSVLVKCHLPLPTYLLADEKQAKCLTERVYAHHRQRPGHLASGIERVQKRRRLHGVLWRVSKGCTRA